MKIAGLIVAAGLSRRMGAFKPLLPLNGKTIIETAVDSLRSTGASPIVVVLGCQGNRLRQKLQNADVDFVFNEAFQTTGMFESVKLGLRFIKENKRSDAVYILPGDMPAVAARTLGEMQNMMESDAYDMVFPSINHRRVHPPLIKSNCIEWLLAYNGTDGLRGAFRQFDGKIGYVVTDDEGCAMDADTEDDYQRLIAYMH